MPTQLSNPIPSDAVILESILRRQQRNLNLWDVILSAPISMFDRPFTIMATSYWAPITQKLKAQSTLEVLLAEIEGLKRQQVGEHTPAMPAIDRAKFLIGGAAFLVHSAPPEGELDSYYGELGVEWRKGDRILRLTCFGDPNTPARLDYGTMSTATPGEYNSDAVADFGTLAARLDWVSEGTESKTTA